MYKVTAAKACNIYTNRRFVRRYRWIIFLWHHPFSHRSEAHLLVKLGSNPEVQEIVLLSDLGSDHIFSLH